MVGFLKRIFGGGEAEEAKPASKETYEGFEIAATPIAESGQFRLAGTISKEVGGELKEHKYIRADLFTTKDQAEEFAMQKGRQMIDQMGERVFDQ